MLCGDRNNVTKGFMVRPLQGVVSSHGIIVMEQKYDYEVSSEQTWNKFVVCSQALYELLDSEEDGEVYQKDVVVYLRAQNKGATQNIQAGFTKKIHIFTESALWAGDY